MERRLNEFNIGPGEKVRVSVGNARRVVSWELDRERFKLEPVFDERVGGRDSAAGVLS